MRVSSGVRGDLTRFLWGKMDRAPLLLYRNRKPVNFSTGTVGHDFLSHPAYLETDVVHLHWINDGFVRLKDIGRIRKPLIWTLRDMWPMTGGCHYSMTCDQFKSGCGSCPLLGSSMEHDLSRWVYSRKLKYIPEQAKIVGISTWMANQARASKLFESHDVRMILNAIDTDEFFPIEKAMARKILGISADKNLVLAGAQNLDAFYKGFDKLLTALTALDQHRYRLCFFGNVDRKAAEATGLDATFFGFLNDTISLRLVYSAADVFVAPSLMEAFGKTLAESMACGTPVVCFDATGPQDIVDHRLNGYRARPFDTNDLADGIKWVCSSERPGSLQGAARAKALQAFDPRRIAAQYVSLYQEVTQ
jgi:glycosyltransferase involved in cell wall biosynthesis